MSNIGSVDFQAKLVFDPDKDMKALQGVTAHVKAELDTSVLQTQINDFLGSKSLFVSAALDESSIRRLETRLNELKINPKLDTKTLKDITAEINNITVKANNSQGSKSLSKDSVADAIKQASPYLAKEIEKASNRGLGNLIGGSLRLFESTTTSISNIKNILDFKEVQAQIASLQSTIKATGTIDQAMVSDAISKSVNALVGNIGNKSLLPKELEVKLQEIPFIVGLQKSVNDFIEAQADAILQASEQAKQESKNATVNVFQALREAIATEVKNTIKTTRIKEPTPEGNKSAVEEVKSNIKVKGDKVQNDLQQRLTNTGLKQLAKQTGITPDGRKSADIAKQIATNVSPDKIQEALDVLGDKVLKVKFKQNRHDKREPLKDESSVLQQFTEKLDSIKEAYNKEDRDNVSLSNQLNTFQQELQKVSQTFKTSKEFNRKAGSLKGTATKLSNNLPVDTTKLTQQGKEYFNRLLVETTETLESTFDASKVDIAKLNFSESVVKALNIGEFSNEVEGVIGGIIKSISEAESVKLAATEDKPDSFLDKLLNPLKSTVTKLVNVIAGVSNNLESLVLSFKKASDKLIKPDFKTVVDALSPEVQMKNQQEVMSLLVKELSSAFPTVTEEELSKVTVSPMTKDLEAQGMAAAFDTAANTLYLGEEQLNRMRAGLEYVVDGSKESIKGLELTLHELTHAAQLVHQKFTKLDTYSDKNNLGISDKLSDDERAEAKRRAKYSLDIWRKQTESHIKTPEDKAALDTQSLSVQLMELEAYGWSTKILDDVYKKLQSEIKATEIPKVSTDNDKATVEIETKKIIQTFRDALQSSLSVENLTAFPKSVKDIAVVLEQIKNTFVAFNKELKLFVSEFFGLSTEEIQQGKNTSQQGRIPPMDDSTIFAATDSALSDFDKVFGAFIDGFSSILKDIDVDKIKSLSVETTQDNTKFDKESNNFKLNKKTFDSISSGQFELDLVYGTDPELLNDLQSAVSEAIEAVTGTQLAGLASPDALKVAKDSVVSEIERLKADAPSDPEAKKTYLQNIDNSAGHFIFKALKSLSSDKATAAATEASDALMSAIEPLENLGDLGDIAELEALERLMETSSEPSEPSKPSEPSEPSKPSEPSEPSKPSEPSSGDNYQERQGFLGRLRLSIDQFSEWLKKSINNLKTALDGFTAWVNQHLKGVREEYQPSIKVLAVADDSNTEATSAKNFIGNITDTIEKSMIDSIDKALQNLLTSIEQDKTTAEGKSTESTDILDDSKSFIGRIKSAIEKFLEWFNKTIDSLKKAQENLEAIEESDILNKNRTTLPSTSSFEDVFEVVKLINNISKHIKKITVSVVNFKDNLAELERISVGLLKVNAESISKLSNNNIKINEDGENIKDTFSFNTEAELVSNISSKFQDLSDTLLSIEIPVINKTLGELEIFQTLTVSVAEYTKTLVDVFNDSTEYLAEYYNIKKPTKPAEKSLKPKEPFVEPTSFIQESLPPVDFSPILAAADKTSEQSNIFKKSLSVLTDKIGDLLPESIIKKIDSLNLKKQLSTRIDAFKQSLVNEVTSLESFKSLSETKIFKQLSGAEPIDTKDVVNSINEMSDGFASLLDEINNINIDNLANWDEAFKQKFNVDPSEILNNQNSSGLLSTIQGVLDEINTADKDIEDFYNKVQNVGAEFLELHPIVKSVFKTVAIGAASFVAFKGIQKLVGLTQEWLETTLPAVILFEGLERTFNQLTGSLELGALEITKAMETANEYGAALESTLEAYKSLMATTRGTSLAGDGTDAIFEALVSTSKNLGLSEQQFDQSMNAIVQIASKGTVSMEELRQQLAEALPGAFQIAARSMNMTEAAFTDLVSSGQLAANEFLPKFAKQLSLESQNFLTEGTQSTGSKLTQIDNKRLTVDKQIGETLAPIRDLSLDIELKTLEAFSTVLKGVNEAAKVLLPTLITIAGFAGKAFVGWVVGLKATVPLLKALVGVTLTAKYAVIGLGKAMVTALAPAVLPIIALTVAFEALKFAYNTFVKETTQDRINKGIRESLDETTVRVNRLKKELQELKNEAEGEILPVNSNSIRSALDAWGDARGETLAEGNLFKTISQDVQGAFSLIGAFNENVVTSRKLLTLKKSEESGSLFNLKEQIKNTVADGDTLLATGEELQARIGQLTAKYSSASGVEQDNIGEQLQIARKELAILAAQPEGLLGTVAATIKGLESDLATTEDYEYSKQLIASIDELKALESDLQKISLEIGSSNIITNYAQQLREVSRDFETLSREVGEFTTLQDTLNTETLRNSLSSNYFAESIADINNLNSELQATQDIGQGINDKVSELQKLINSASGEIAVYVDRYSELNLEQLNSQLDKTSDKEIARTEALNSLIELREAESEQLNNQLTEQEQLLALERAKMDLAQQRLDLELQQRQGADDISQSEARADLANLESQGGVSATELRDVELEAQKDALKRSEDLRQFELDSIKKIYKDQLISKKDYEDRVLELTIQGATNREEQAELELAKELNRREQLVNELERESQRLQIASERDSISNNIASNVNENQQTATNRQITKDDINSQILTDELDYQKQLLEQSQNYQAITQNINNSHSARLDIIGQEYDNKVKLLALEKEQQLLQLQSEQSSLKLAQAEAEIELRKLEANKASQAEIAIAQETVALKQESLSVLDSQLQGINDSYKGELEILDLQQQQQVQQEIQKTNLDLLANTKDKLNQQQEITVSQLALENQALQEQLNTQQSQISIQQAQRAIQSDTIAHQEELASFSENLDNIEKNRAETLRANLDLAQQEYNEKVQLASIEKQRQTIEAQRAIQQAQYNIELLKATGASKEALTIAENGLALEQLALQNILREYDETVRLAAITVEQTQQQLLQKDILDQKAAAVQRITEQTERQADAIDLQTAALERQVQLAQSMEDVSKLEADNGALLLSQDLERLKFEQQKFEAAGNLAELAKTQQEIFDKTIDTIEAETKERHRQLDIQKSIQDIELKSNKLEAQKAVNSAKASLEQLKLKGAASETLKIAQQQLESAQSDVQLLDEQFRLAEDLNTLEKERIDLEAKGKKEAELRTRELQKQDTELKKIAAQFDLISRNSDIQISNLNNQQTPLDLQSNILNAQQNLSQSQFDVATSEVDLDITKLRAEQERGGVDNSAAINKLIKERYELEIQALVDSQKMEQELFKVKQKQLNISLEIAKIEQQTALARAKSDLARRQAEGASPAELAQLSNVVALAEDSLKLSNLSAESQRQVLNLEQQTALNNQQVSLNNLEAKGYNLDFEKPNNNKQDSQGKIEGFNSNAADPNFFSDFNKYVDQYRKDLAAEQANTWLSQNNPTKPKELPNPPAVPNDHLKDISNSTQSLTAAVSELKYSIENFKQFPSLTVVSNNPTAEAAKLLQDVTNLV